MISKTKIKEIRFLKTKKGRQRTGSFVVEGEKMVSEMLQSDFHVHEIFGLPEWGEKMTDNDSLISKYHEITEQELRKISSLTTPNNVLAIASLKDEKFDINQVKSNLCIGIDSLQDPGNFGTIIRIANWYGINHVICSHDTVELYNPKVIQATMGSIFRVHVYYTNLVDLLASLSSNVPVYGTFLEGDDIYQLKLSDHGIVFFGNESRGISNPLARVIRRKIRIPSYPKGNNTMESLNVSAAVAIACSEFRRQALSFEMK